MFWPNFFNIKKVQIIHKGDQSLHINFINWHHNIVLLIYTIILFLTHITIQHNIILIYTRITHTHTHTQNTTIKINNFHHHFSNHNAAIIIHNTNHHFTTKNSTFINHIHISFITPSSNCLGQVWVIKVPYCIWIGGMLDL